MMDISAVKKYCRSFAGVVEKIAGEPANILSFSVRDKKIAYFKTSDPERWRFSIRVTPERFLELTDQPGIKPARYMHRFYWVSITKVRSVDEGYLKELIDRSYSKAFQSLPKKIQKEIGN